MSFLYFILFPALTITIFLGALLLYSKLEEKQCPHCNSTINKKTVICPCCNHDLNT